MLRGGELPFGWAARATGSNDGGEEIEDGGGAPGLQVAEGAGGAVPLGEGVVAELAAAIFLHGVRGQFPSQEKSSITCSQVQASSVAGQRLSREGT
ncbi:unnamed protein product [Urochloa humidicola]